MEQLLAHPLVQHLIDQLLIWQEWLQEIPWQIIDEFVSRFVFYYPLLMAYVWMIGGIIYFLQWEIKLQDFSKGPPPLLEYPPISILIPCYNEGENVRETIEYLLHQNYPNYEIIAVNDGSKDNTL
jgi:biofilm PGA synthesis N-glycosyltransferase PgaC